MDYFEDKILRDRDIIRIGTDLLKEKKAYSLKRILFKLEVLGYRISASSYSNILNEKRRAGKTIVIKMLGGIKKLIHMELGLDYSKEKKAFLPTDDIAWKEETVSPLPKNDGLIVHGGGRLTVEEEVDFIKEAKKEVIYLGLSLANVANYFFNLRDDAYKSHVESLLLEGVNIKCYFLDPDSNEARIYHNDIRKHRYSYDGIEETKRAIEKFTLIRQNFFLTHENEEIGKFELYLYRHIPSYSFLMIDPDKPYGKLLISHYLFGISFPNNPTLELSKRENSIIFRKYVESAQALTRDAKAVNNSTYFM